MERCGGERECRKRSAERWEWKRQAGYWKSQHGRAKERGERLRERLRAEQAQHRVMRKKLVQTQAECAALQRQAVVGEQEREALQQQVAEWRQAAAGQPPNRADLLRAAFGARSEKRAPEPEAGEADAVAGRSGRRARGGQPGAKAHPRVARPELEERTEERDLPAERRVCGDCGRPFQRHGVAVSERVEVEVRSYRRRIRRPRYRAACECAQARGQQAPTVQAGLPPTLFRGTCYGLSVWVEFLLQVYWQRRPVRAFEREWAERGLALPASSLLGHQQDFVHWFAPLEQAIGVQQRQALLVHGDETSWRVQARGEQGHNPRCWLWACLTSEAVRFRVDPARSAAAAKVLFGPLGQSGRAVLVCDRYAAYDKLARDHAGQLELAICWAHARRDFVRLADRHPPWRTWAEGIVRRIGELYRLHRERHRHWQPERDGEHQSARWQALQEQFATAMSAFFAYVESEQQSVAASAPVAGDPRLGPLTSLLRYRTGLSVCVQQPCVPMDNNRVERALRPVVIGRQLSHGSHSATGAELQGLLLSVCSTLDMAGIDLERWLEAFLGECARQGPGATVPEPQEWLPWGMPPDRRQALLRPG